jgi:hypothetical protein
MDLFHDAGFWGFLTTVIGAARWLMKVAYAYRLRSEREKHSYSMELLKGLDATVKAIRPVVESHTKIINSFQATAQEITNAEVRILKCVGDSTAMMNELKVQYGNFKDVAQKSEAVSLTLIKEIEGIKTEIIQLKNGNIFVRTKK